ncbi:MAG: hypothetical protein MJZ21_04875 [archaeon]|nr:hypothetical protein [archaeon]
MMWKTHVGNGNNVIANDLGEALACFCSAADMVDDKEMSDCFQDIVDSLIENLSTRDYPEEQMVGFVELTGIFLERSEGESFLPSELVNRGVGYLEEGTSSVILSNIFRMVPYGLCASYDPEDYILIFEDLAYLVFTAKDASSEENVSAISAAFSDLLERFRTPFKALDEDGYFRIAEKIDADEDQMIAAAFRNCCIACITDIPADERDEIFNGFIDLFFE